jgi:hypothetical protein
MQEAQLVDILMKMAERLGYKWRIENIEFPTVKYFEKVISLRAEDLVLYHVLHEIAHILIGYNKDGSDKNTALNEAMAESISIRVRTTLGFALHAGDATYVQGWLESARISRKTFEKQYGSVIQAHTATILDYLSKGRDESTVVNRCVQQLATHRAVIKRDG